MGYAAARAAQVVGMYEVEVESVEVAVSALDVDVGDVMVSVEES